MHLTQIVNSIISATDLDDSLGHPAKLTATLVDDIARLNMLHSLRQIYQESPVVAELVDSGKALLVGAMYDVATGRVKFLDSKEEILRGVGRHERWKKSGATREATL